MHCYVTLADYATIEVLQYQHKAGATGQLLVDTVNAYEYEAEQLLVGDTSPASGAYSATASPAPSEVFLPVLRQGDERRAHIVIIGTGAMAQSVAYTVAHLCHYPNYAEGGQRTRITFIGEGMEAWQQHLVASRPALLAMRWRMPPRFPTSSMWSGSLLMPPRRRPWRGASSRPRPTRCCVWWYARAMSGRP